MWRWHHRSHFPLRAATAGAQGLSLVRSRAWPRPRAQTAESRVGGRRAVRAPRRGRDRTSDSARLINSATVPPNRTWPAVRRVTRSAKPRISSNRCVVQITAVPLAAASRTSPRTRCDPSGSRSCVASSTRSARGSHSKARATESRFCIPCEYEYTGSVATSESPTSSIRARARRRASRRRGRTSVRRRQGSRALRCADRTSDRPTGRAR